MSRGLETLVHIGWMRRAKQGGEYLFLRADGKERFTWYEVVKEWSEERASSCAGKTVEEAISSARCLWKEESFRLVHCGFRYTLPARDLVGCNALFRQMVASYSTSNGVYFDAAEGGLCFVDNASQEALDIWRTLKNLYAGTPS